MNKEILTELSFFLISMLSGCIILAAYDFLRIFRSLVRHNAFFTGMEDLLYWAAAGLFIFKMMQQYNSGIVRGFSIAGSLLGMILYQEAFSWFVVWLISSLMRLIFHIIYRIIGVLLLPLRFIGRGLKKFAQFVRNKLGKCKNFLKNSLKKSAKEDKIKKNRKHKAKRHKAKRQQAEGGEDESNTGKQKKKKEKKRA